MCELRGDVGSRRGGTRVANTICRILEGFGSQIVDISMLLVALDGVGATPLVILNPGSGCCEVYAGVEHSPGRVRYASVRRAEGGEG